MTINIKARNTTTPESPWFKGILKKLANGKYHITYEDGDESDYWSETDENAVGNDCQWLKNAVECKFIMLSDGGDPAGTRTEENESAPAPQPAPAAGETPATEENETACEPAPASGHLNRHQQRARLRRGRLATSPTRQPRQRASRRHRNRHAQSLES